jgi:exosortase/archaeosortase family protein
MGFKVLCFWIAFILANEGELNKKLKWIFFGCLTICFINILRFTMVLIAENGKWGKTINMDNHDWFNVFSYGFVFLMIFFFDRSSRKNKGFNNPKTIVVY